MAKILVVDDNDSILKVVTVVLGSKGHVVATCAEPRDGLEKLASEYFDLLITDLMMPGGINGFDFIKTLRNMENLTELPVIILTGRRETKDVERGIKVGADDYIVKPIDPEILVSKVDTLLEKKSRKEAAFTPTTVKASAIWDVLTEISQLTEIGVLIKSQIPMPLGLKVKLKSDFFEEVGIQPPFLRIVSCEEVKASGNYSIEAHFMGLSEKELTPIRLWIRNSKIAKS